MGRKTKNTVAELEAELASLKGSTVAGSDELKGAEMPAVKAESVHTGQTEADGKFLRLAVVKLRDTQYSQGIHMGISNVTAAFMAYHKCDRDTAIARINACAVKIKNRETGMVTHGSGHIAIIPQGRSGKAKKGHLRMYLSEEAPKGKANDGTGTLKTMGL